MPDPVVSGTGPQSAEVARDAAIGGVVEWLRDPMEGRDATWAYYCEAIADDIEREFLRRERSGGPGGGDE